MADGPNKGPHTDGKPDMDVGKIEDVAKEMAAMTAAITVAQIKAEKIMAPEKAAKGISTKGA